MQPSADNDARFTKAPEKVVNLDMKRLDITAKIGQRSDLKAVHSETSAAFVIPNVMRSEECEGLIKKAEAAGFDSLERLFPNDYRSNDRLLMRSHYFAQSLFDRIALVFKPGDLRLHPMGPGANGIWLPYGMNEMIKIARYRPGCHFKAHRDGPWCPSNDRMSLFTFIVYLNSSGPLPLNAGMFSGGETRFKADKVIACVMPKQGTALVFSHQLPHDGAAILGGTKYILRTEIMFRRVPSVLDPTPAFLAASEELKRIMNAYEQSCKAIGEDKEKFLKAYLAAIELQNQTITTPLAILPLPADVLLMIFEYLADTTILRTLAGLSKSWYRICRDNSFWKKRFLREFPEEIGRAPADLSQDWLQWYRNAMQSRLSHHLTPPAFAIDFSSSTIKTHRMTWHHPPLRAPAFYESEVLTYGYHSHSARVRTSGFVGAKYENMREIIDNDEESPYEYGIENGAISGKGMEWLMHCNAWSGQIMLPPNERNFVFIVSDAWEDEHLRLILAGKALSAHLLWARPRFVQYSVAVSKHYAMPSCLVLHAGYCNHFISVVQNFHVILHQKLLNVTPKQTSRVALLVHQVLMGYDMVLPSAVDDENKASAAITALRAGNEVQRQFAAKLTEILESHIAANPNNSEIMRDIVGYNVIITGDHLSSTKWEKYAQNVEKALYAHSSKWKVQTRKVAEEAVRGAASLGFYGPNTFSYGGGLPLTPLEPRDLNDDNMFQ